jgi:hypothetical protein
MGHNERPEKQIREAPKVRGCLMWLSVRFGQGILESGLISDQLREKHHFRAPAQFRAFFRLRSIQ